MTTPAKLTVKRITRAEGTGATRACCDVVIGGAFLIKGVKIVNGKNGLFVSLPSERGRNGHWYDTVVPLSTEMRRHLSQVVLDAFEAGMEQPVG